MAAAVAAGDRAADVGAAVRRRGAAARATTRWSWWRRAPRRTREHRLLRAALEGLADEPVRVLATDQPAAARRADRRAGERAARRLGLLRPDDAALRRGGLPRRPRHGGARAGERARRGGLPRAGDMAENAARIGWAGLGVSLPRRFHTARGVRLAVRRLLADRRYAERAAASPGLVLAARWSGNCSSRT